MNELKNKIEAAWEDRSLLTNPETIAAIREVVALCDAGTLRCSEPNPDTERGWQVN